MASSIEFHGLDEVSKVLGRGVAAQKALARAVFSEAETVLNESKKIVPVDTGVLKNSGQVNPPKIEPGAVEVEVTYGGAAAPYALYVHEDPEARHEPGKTYKYLEIPVMAHRDKFARNVKVRFISWLRTGM